MSTDETGKDVAEPPRERTILRAPGAIIGTSTAWFDALALPIAAIRAVRTEGDDRSGVFGLLLATNLFIAAAIAFWLPFVAGYWGPKFLIAVALLGGVGLSMLQDAIGVPDRHVTKLMVLTEGGDRVVFVSKDAHLVERIADAILEAKRGAGMAPAPLPPPRRELRSVARAFSEMKHRAGPEPDPAPSRS